MLHPSCGQAVLDVEDGQEASSVVDRGRRRVQAPHGERAIVHTPVIVGGQPVCGLLIFTDIVLRGPLVAEEQQHVFAVANGPEVGHRSILARFGVEAIFDQRPEELPIGQVP